MEQATAERLNVIAVDSSEHSERAFNWYCSHLHQSNSKVGLIHVHEVPTVQVTGIPEFGPDLMGLYHKECDRSLAKSKAVVQHYEKLCTEKNMNHVSFFRTVDDSVGNTICKIAKENGAEMIVIGQRGLGTIRRTFLGSVSDYVIHHAHIPTVVVPPEE